jgi:hypothetical protein
MTIDELLAITGLTASDEIPVWDAEATEEPTKKITAANLAAAMIALANLVTGVKGDSESSYRHGDVNITPANIGALPDTTPIPSKTSDLTNDSGFLSSSTGVTGVKGNAESTYRKGQVNLTPDDLGALQREIDRATFSDLNNNRLTGHATLTNNPSYVGRGYVTNLPPGMTTGYKWYSVYLLGSVEMAVGYTEPGALWVRAYEESTWGSWHLVGGCTITSSVTSGGAGTIVVNELTRSGNVCTIYAWLQMSSTLPGNNGLFGTVPDGFIPSSDRRISGFVSSLGLIHTFVVKSNGEIRTSTTSSTYAASGYILVFGSYII